MRAVEARIARVRAAVVERLRAELPDALVEEGAEGVTVSAARLKRRWVRNDRLRSLSWWLS